MCIRDRSEDELAIERERVQTLYNEAVDKIEDQVLNSVLAEVIPLLGKKGDFNDVIQSWELEPNIYACRSVVRTLLDEVTDQGRDLSRQRQAVESGQGGYINRFGRAVQTQSFAWRFRGQAGIETAGTYLMMKDTYKALNEMYKLCEQCIEQRSTNTNTDVDHPVDAGEREEEADGAVA